MNNPDNYDLTKSPEDGCYTYGFYIEGASWNSEQNQVDEPIPKLLYPTMPYIWFKPIRKSDLNKGEVFVCPVYRTSKRQGELNTSGQSTNFLISFFLYFDKSKYTVDHWIKRGTAILTSLNE